MSIIETRGLVKAYPGQEPVLRGVDLSVTVGERVALIGANGSGKTTLLKSLIGLHGISGGEIETLGETFAKHPSSAQIRRLRLLTGFVFQRHCLVKRRSVLSNVVHGLLGAPGSWRAFCQTTAPAEWRNRAMEALAEVNLADKAMRRADELSGGQQQRVAVARALVRRPKLLIADEPSASLDPAAGRDVMALFSALCRRHNITMVFTSHDMSHATEFSDRIVALKNGRIDIDAPASRVSDKQLEATFA